jgi:hypothetical protein
MSQYEASRPGDAPLEEAESLIWALLDEHLDDAGVTRLSKMIECDAAVRARYLACVQLHVDLCDHFGRRTTEPNNSTVVLPNLGPGILGVPGLPQSTQ